MPTSQRTHYDVLGLPRDADAVRIRAAWKLHVQAWHPDRFGDDLRLEAERQTSRINEAYTVLRDAGRRAAYDCRLAADERDAERAAAPQRSRPVRPARPSAARGPVMPVRLGTAPIGSPMAEPAPLPRQTLVDQIDGVIIDLRRHPRITATAVVACVALLLGAVSLQLFAGPSAPAGSSVAVAAGSAMPEFDDRSEDTETLAQLAEEARQEAEEAEQEMAELLEQDLEAAAKADAAAAAAAAMPPPAAPVDPRAGRSLAPRAAVPQRRGTTPPRARRGAPSVARGGRRIVRIMPTG